MAIQSNRALLACSVLALASAIVTLYYWQLRKRRKHSSPPAPAVCGERIVVVEEEEEEGDSQILSPAPTATTVAAVTTTITATTTTTTTVVEQIKVLDNCKSHVEEDTVDGAVCVEEKSSCITIASTVVANYSCPFEADAEATSTSAPEMANEVEVHDDCRTDSICSDSSPLVDSVLEGGGGCSTETGAPELTKELSTGGSDGQTTDTVATAADSGSVAVDVENRTPATSAAVADAGAAAAATTASDVVVTPTETPLQVDNQQKLKEQEQQQAAKSGHQTQAQTSPPASSKPASDTAAATSAAAVADVVVSAGASTSTSTASVAATTDASSSTTTIRVAPAVTSRKIITSNPVTSSQTFAQVLAKKNAAAVPSTKQSKKMAQSSGPKPVDQPKIAAKAAAASSAKAAVSYASVVQESSGNSSPTSPHAAIATNTSTTISSSSSKQQEEVDAYRNYPDATSATPSQSSSSIEGQCSPNSDLGDQFTCDVRSLGSNDSGTGSSELLHADTTITNGGDHSQQSSPASAYHIVNSSDNSSPTATATPPEDPSAIVCYQFELPFYLCGKLIGSNGHYINFVKQSSGTQIIVSTHYVPSHKICSITGTKAGINTALNLIRKRFPFKEYPDVSLAPLPNPSLSVLPQSCQLQLAPDHVANDVILSCHMSPGHFFLQQPTHPTYPQLNQLDHLMKIHYSEGSAPQLPDVYPGLLCAAPTEEGWYRAMIKVVHQSKNQCDIMFVDYGGFAFNVPVATLRPIRSDFIVLPFQASECFLANVVPVDAKNGWSTEANQFFVEQAQGQIIHAEIDDYDENGTPFVTLFKFSQGGNRTDINAELVAKGYAYWTESDESKLNGKN